MIRSVSSIYGAVTPHRYLLPRYDLLILAPTLISISKLYQTRTVAVLLTNQISKFRSCLHVTICRNKELPSDNSICREVDIIRNGVGTLENTNSRLFVLNLLERDVILKDGYSVIFNSKSNATLKVID